MEATSTELTARRNAEKVMSGLLSLNTLREIVDDTILEVLTAAQSDNFELEPFLKKLQQEVDAFEKSR